MFQKIFFTGNKETKLCSNIRVSRLADFLDYKWNSKYGKIVFNFQNYV